MNITDPTKWLEFKLLSPSWENLYDVLGTTVLKWGLIAWAKLYKIYKALSNTLFSTKKWRNTFCIVKIPKGLLQPLYLF